MILKDWLDKEGLAHLHNVLAAEGVDFDVLSSLSATQLETWKIAWGDQQRLLRAIGRLGEATAPSDGQVSRTKASGPERRQMTVFFSDMVGSTALSTRLDPEDFREAIDRYIHAVNDAVAPYEGYIAKYMGDGILVYFGYPHAHEDDPQRAIYSALRAIKAVSRLRIHTGEALQTRIGIATGVVVIDETGAGTAAAETAATGQTMNLAARLQACAAPEEVVIADETRRLVGNTFEVEAIEGLELKGFSEKITAWRVMGQQQNSTSARASQQSLPIRKTMQGREHELGLLWERWQLVSEQLSQTVLLSGEPGIGKTTLTKALVERIRAEGGLRLHLKASPYFSNTVLHPVTEGLLIEAGVLHEENASIKKEKLIEFFNRSHTPQAAQSWLLKLFGLLSDPNLDGLPASEQRRLTFEAIREVFSCLARDAALQVLLEDAQWLDPTTNALLESIATCPIASPILFLVTSRVEYRPAWSQDPQCLYIRLEKLGDVVAQSIITRITDGREFPPALTQDIIRRTNGNPLFIEELTRSIVESGLLIETAQGFELMGDLSSLSVPATLQDSLMARLDRMGPYKEIAQVGSVIGHEFSHQLLRYVLSTRPAHVLKLAVTELLQAELWVEREVGGLPGYGFRHALIQETAYQSMLKGQRALRHWQVAKAIEVLDKAAAQDTPELLALHHQEGGLYPESIRYWTSAGSNAALRSAHIESTKSFRQSLSLLGYLDEDDERIRTEFEIQMRLGGVLMDAEGFKSDDAQSALHRSVQLASQLEDPNYYIDACANVSGTLQAKGAFSEVVRLLENVSDEKLKRCTPSFQAKYFACLGISKMFLGMFDQSWSEFEAALEWSRQAEQAQREGKAMAPPWSIPIRAYGSKVLAYRGQLDQAQKLVEEAYEISLNSVHVIEKLSGMQLKTWMLLLSGEFDCAQAMAQVLLQQSERLGIKVRLAGVLSYLGEMALMRGDLSRGCETLEEAYSLLETFSGTMTLPEFATRAADAMLRVGLTQEAQSMLKRIDGIALEAGRAFVEAEYLRLMGQIAQAQQNPTLALRLYQDAHRLAQDQHAGLFSLRATSQWLALETQLGQSPLASEPLRHALDNIDCAHSFPDLVTARKQLYLLRH
ncbi:MAG: hypothetical protein EB072_00030 [Betaproteobacteria bacterium]|nr:hypothetical protein [Betaproteobacteria bacterium]